MRWILTYYLIQAFFIGCPEGIKECAEYAYTREKYQIEFSNVEEMADWIIFAVRNDPLQNIEVIKIDYWMLDKNGDYHVNPIVCEEREEG